MQDVKHELRTTLYLTRKAEALLGALRFFNDPSTPMHRQLQFLAQSDFWEWEIDNLIYSFSNFQERDPPPGALHQLWPARITEARLPEAARKPT